MARGSRNAKLIHMIATLTAPTLYTLDEPYYDRSLVRVAPIEGGFTVTFPASPDDTGTTLGEMVLLSRADEAACLAELGYSV